MTNRMLVFLYAFLLKAVLYRFFLYEGVKKRIKTFCYTFVTSLPVI